MPPEHPNKKFTADVRDTYIESLRTGNLKFESARLAGISYRTVERHRRDDDDFADNERLALMEAREGIEKVLFEMAKEGDLGAIDRWLKAHDRSTYGSRTTLEIDATDNAVQLTQAQALGKVADLQKTLAERHARLVESGDVIDVLSIEVTDVSHTPETDNVTDVSPTGDKPFKI